MKHAAVAALLLLAPTVAPAQSLRLMDTSVLEYRGVSDNGVDDDDEYAIGINKLYVNGQQDATSVSAQVDSVLFLTAYPDVAAPTAANPSSYASEARLERITLVHSLADGAGTLTLGDSHLQLGRGLVLSLRKVDELGADQALRGGGASFDGDTFSARAFAGRTNVANLDPVTQRFLEDPDDTLAGASATLHLGTADLSLHGLYLEPRIGTLETDDGDFTSVGGAYLDLPAFDWLSLYLEGAFEQYRMAGRDTRGSAAYASMDLDLQVVSLLVEGLWLDAFRVAGSPNEVLGQPHRYNEPPTLERIDQEITDRMENVRGGRARISRPFLDGDLVLYVNGAYRQFGSAGALDDDALHGYGGFELYYGGGSSRWFASGGYRTETKDAETEPFKTMTHAETDWVQAVGDAWALHLTVNHEDRTLRSLATEPARDYVRGSTLFGFDRARLGSLMAEVGYDTQNPERQSLFVAGILAWEAADWATVRGVIGTQRGGIKCIGGVCRDFPPFAGARLEATVLYDAL